VSTWTENAHPAEVDSFDARNLFVQVDEGLRRTFFEDAIAIMNRDQYGDVNVLTPAATQVQGALPPDLQIPYMRALISQSKSGAWKGAPAAKAALSALPFELMDAAFRALDAKTLYWESGNEAVKLFLARYKTSWPASQQELFSDYLRLTPWDFGTKHAGVDF
jgi:hypothetical protein